MKDIYATTKKATGIKKTLSSSSVFQVLENFFVYLYTSEID